MNIQLITPFRSSDMILGGVNLIPVNKLERNLSENVAAGLRH